MGYIYKGALLSSTSKFVENYERKKISGFEYHQ